MKLNSKQIIIVTILVLLLAMVRMFNKSLFYDPFSEYFEGEFINRPFPNFDSFKLFLSLAFRYGLNSILSVGIIYTVFKDLNIAKFACILYGILFVILIGMLFSILKFSDEQNPFLLFYVRRFLIQPLFVILFLPAFYFQKRNI